MRLALVNIADGAEAYGLITLASYIREYSDFDDIHILNLNNFEGFITQTNLPIEEYITWLEEIKPDVIGLSAMTVFYGKAVKTAMAIRDNKKLKDCRIIIGGVHISTLPSSFKNVFDYGVLGEGEETLLELLTYIKNNKTEDYEKLEKIKGIAYYRDNSLKINEKRPLIESLDKIPLPHPDYAPIGIDPGFLNGKKVKSALIMTSRGCPYRCVFCSTTVFWGNRIRFNSAERVVKELEMWHNKYGVTNIDIWDDLFTINKPRLIKILELLEEKKLLGKLHFSCMARSNTIDNEVCKLLKKLNVYSLNFGFESGSEKTLAFLKKNSVTVEQHKKAIKLAKKHGIQVAGSLIFGSPGEKLDDMKKTLDFVDFCIKNKVDSIWSFIMTPFPGTEMWELAKKKGKVADDMDWDTVSHFNYMKPMLLDDDVKYEDFKKVWFKNKAKLRYFLIKIWLKNFRDAPFVTVRDLLKSFRFIKFFTKEF